MRLKPSDCARAGQAIKQRALSRLPELLEELEANCTRNGIRVHWAETPAVANRIVLDIVNAHSATGRDQGQVHGVRGDAPERVPRRPRRRGRRNGSRRVHHPARTARPPPTSSSRPSTRTKARSHRSSTRSCRARPTPRRWPSSTPLRAAPCAAGSTRPPWG